MSLMLSDPCYALAGRNFLRRQIRAYVEQHMTLLPRTVILTAVWNPATAAAAAGVLVGEALESAEDTLPSPSDPAAVIEGEGPAIAGLSFTDTAGSAAASTSGRPPDPAVGTLWGTAEVRMC